LQRRKIFSTVSTLLVKHPHNLPISLTFEIKVSRQINGYFEWLKAHMTDANRQIILMLKEAAIQGGKYKTHIFSSDIYKAVMEHEVKNLSQFKHYLKGIGKSLDQ
jgi:hypothetical protein